MYRSRAAPEQGFKVSKVGSSCAHNVFEMSNRRPLAPHALPARPAVSQAERWAIQGGDAATTTLTIPADAKRERRFEIGCAVTVGVPEDAVTPWLEVTVQANTTLQWRRRADAHNPGAWDGLDYRFRHSVPVGQALRVTVSVRGQGVRRRSLSIEAEEG